VHGCGYLSSTASADSMRRLPAPACSNKEMRKCCRPQTSINLAPILAHALLLLVLLLLCSCALTEGLLPRFLLASNSLNLRQGSCC
jgi:hypothetical protein